MYKKFGNFPDPDDEERVPKKKKKPKVRTPNKKPVPETKGKTIVTKKKRPNKKKEQEDEDKEPQPEDEVEPNLEAIREIMSCKVTSQVFDKIDKDQDTSISRGELKAYYNGPIYDYLYEDALSNPEAWKKKWGKFVPKDTSLFELLDINQNNKITLTELEAQCRELDTNNDLRVTKVEFAAWLKARESFIIQPYINKIRKALDKLNRQTRSS